MSTAEQLPQDLYEGYDSPEEYFQDKADKYMLPGGDWFIEDNLDYEGNTLGTVPDYDQFQEIELREPDDTIDAGVAWEYRKIADASYWALDDDTRQVMESVVAEPSTAKTLYDLKKNEYDLTDPANIALLNELYLLAQNANNPDDRTRWYAEQRLALHRALTVGRQQAENDEPENGVQEPQVVDPEQNENVPPPPPSRKGRGARSQRNDNATDDKPSGTEEPKEAKESEAPGKPGESDELSDSEESSSEPAAAASEKNPRGRGRRQRMSRRPGSRKSVRADIAAEKARLASEAAAVEEFDAAVNAYESANASAENNEDGKEGSDNNEANAANETDKTTRERFMAAVGRIAWRARLSLDDGVAKLGEGTAWLSEKNKASNGKLGKLALAGVVVIGAGLAAAKIVGAFDHVEGAIPQPSGGGAAMPNAHDTLPPPTGGSGAANGGGEAITHAPMDLTVDKGESVYGEIAKAQGWDPKHLTGQQVQEVRSLVDYAFNNNDSLRGVKPTAVHAGTHFSIPGGTNAPANHVEILDAYNSKTGEGTFSHAVHTYLDQINAPKLNNSQFNRLTQQLLDYDHQAHYAAGQAAFDPMAMPRGYQVSLPEHQAIDDMIRRIIDEDEKLTKTN